VSYVIILLYTMSMLPLLDSTIKYLAGIVRVKHSLVLLL